VPSAAAANCETMVETFNDDRYAWEDRKCRPTWMCMTSPV
jgi:hypothetical protein